MVGVTAGRVHLCRVAGDPIWQVTLRSSEMGYHKELYHLTIAQDKAALAYVRLHAAGSPLHVPLR